MTAPYIETAGGVPHPDDGSCPWCERTIARRPDGRLYPHHDLDPRERRLLGPARCDGSNRTPESARRPVVTLAVAGAAL